MSLHGIDWHVNCIFHAYDLEGIRPVSPRSVIDCILFRWCVTNVTARQHAAVMAVLSPFVEPVIRGQFFPGPEETIELYRLRN